MACNKVDHVFAVKSRCLRVGSVKSWQRPSSKLNVSRSKRTKQRVFITTRYWEINWQQCNGRLCNLRLYPYGISDPVEISASDRALWWGNCSCTNEFCETFSCFAELLPSTSPYTQYNTSHNTSPRSFVYLDLPWRHIWMTSYVVASGKSMTCMLCWKHTRQRIAHV